MAAAPSPVVLTPLERRTLEALARTIAPDAALPAGGAVDLVPVVAERLGRMPAPLQRDLRLALAVFGHPLAALLTAGSRRRFAAMDDAARAAFLERWLTSGLAPLRTIAQALRRLVLALWYGDPRSHAGIGYLGPFHRRAPAYPWEGPAPGITRDDEPIARSDDPAAPLPAPKPAIPVPAVRDLPRDADVVVIGSGAGGAVAACRFAEAGRRVVVLEEGPLVQSDAFTEEDAPLTERLYADQGLRTTDDLSLTMVQGATVGGGTTINWMIMLRAAEYVFEEWKRRFGTVGMSPAEMALAYARIEAETHARLVPDDAHSPANRLILDSAARLGWHARAGHVNARGCVRSGFCSHGCRYDAKQGTLVTYLPRAIAAGAVLVPEARAERITVVEPGPRGRKRVHVTRRDPATGAVTRHEIDAPVVVVAGGAVGTPLLLQRSGLGGPAVGKYLRVHPVSGVAGVYDQPLYAGGGMPMTTLCDEFSNRNGTGYGVWIETPPTHPMLVAAALPGFGAAHRSLMTQFAHLGILLVLTRDGADLDASSGQVRADRTGRTRIRYALTPADADNLRHGLVAAAEMHLAAGAREILSLHTTPVRVRTRADLDEIRRRPMGPNQLALFTAHVNGTCRIGTNPATAGADPDGQVHGAPGVYCLDGSLLPTGLGVNPQATIMALSSLLSDRMLARGAV